MNNKKPKAVDKKPAISFKNWYHINVGLWQHDVHVFIGSRQDMVKTMPDALTDYGCNFDRMKKVCDGFRKSYPNFLSETQSGGSCFGSDGEPDIFVWLPEFSYGVEDICIAAHEFLHAANGILRCINLLGDTNVEGLAYTQEFIYGCFLRQYIERNNPENHKEAR